MKNLPYSIAYALIHSRCSFMQLFSFGTIVLLDVAPASDPSGY